MKLSLAITDIIILSLALQGLVLAIILFYSSRRIKSNRWIAAFIFVIAETTFLMEGMRSNVLVKHPQLLEWLPNLRLAIGPLIYLYTRSLIYGDEHTGRKKYLHFLPLLLDAQYQVIGLLYITGILSIPVVTNFYAQPWLQNALFNKTILSDLPTLISMVVYVGMSYKAVIGVTANTEPSAYKLADLKWLKKLLRLVIVLVAVFLVTILLTFVSVWNNYVLYLSGTLFTYWLGMSAIIRQNKMQPADVAEYNQPAVKIYFADASAEEYKQQLVRLMEIDNLYLNPLLKLEMLAEKLSLPDKVVSNLLNQHLKKNFNDFVNEYRVAEAKKRLAEPASSKFTIAAIAYDCGFNSLATFQRCFKQFTGITPSQYQNSIISSETVPGTTQIPI
ncbi:MAG: helix-turn-helix domain-containing protein [Bacteroidota bacterium]